MNDPQNGVKSTIDRRRFVKNGLTTAGAAAFGTRLLAHDSSVLADERSQNHNDSLNKGDVAILRFLAAAEIIETDLWQQYNELGGVQDSEVAGGSGSPLYTAALQVLDEDMGQYIHDNT